jgi:hypothetical protein
MDMLTYAVLGCVGVGFAVAIALIAGWSYDLGREKGQKDVTDLL